MDQTNKALSQLEGCNSFQDIFEKLAEETLLIMREKFDLRLKAGDNRQKSPQSKYTTIKGVKVMAEITQTMEVVGALKSLVEAYSKAMEDGKISFFDVRFLPEVVSKVATAVKGAKEIGAEVKDLDQAEVEQLVQAFLEVVELMAKVPQA